MQGSKSRQVIGEEADRPVNNSETTGQVCEAQ